MKLDTEYSSIDVCPETGEINNNVYRQDGCCPHCGDVKSSITHHDQVPGRWNRPSFFERVFQGKKNEFLSKEDEDKVWNGLQK